MKRPFFESVDAPIDFPAMEERILAFWNEKKIFLKSLEATVGKQEFVFFDGPPFATGLPHYGHLLAGTIKDIIPRYWTMRGRHVSRRFGWDCHGLPVENEMEKEFKISGKKDIEKLGIHFFNEACRSIVLRYTNQWEKVVTRMGRWVDFENQYRTMDAAYMESIWWVFSRVWSDNLVYQGFRVQPYCPRCATPLSNFEVTEGYKETQSPSITVTFPVAKQPNVKFLVWTTTPWTLPSNVALAVGAEIRYVKVQDADTVYIMAKDRVGAYFKDATDVAIIEEVPGKELAGISYEPIFDYFREKSDAFFRVTTADFVSTEDGTGIVHIAPAFGEDDFGVGARLGLPIVCPVDDEGKFTNEVPEFAGQRVYEADDAIIRLLKNRERLIHRSTIQHRYPFCPRCDTALIYKAITTWFLKLSPLKANMLDNNQRIRWVPPHLQNGRFGKGIESAPDWNISRNRYWGTPIPIWLCDCGHKECVGGLSDLHLLIGGGNEAAGRKIHQETVRNVQETIRTQVTEKFDQFGIDASWAPRLQRAEIPQNDIHRHIVDALPVKCPRCGDAMKRTSEVLDCWFESGSMPYAQIHYPFENSTVFDQRFPADFIAEGLDQTRGWFYTLTVLASALFHKEAFKNVIVNGIILAEDGKKLSKRLRNYEPPEEILNKFGADALRLFLIDSPAVKAEDLRFSENGVMEISRSVLLPLWNAYTFFVTYANIDNWSPDSEKTGDSRSELDRWILSLLNSLIRAVDREMEQYNLYRVVPLLVDFIDNLTNWYIRRSRRRFWKSENDDDKDWAYSTLYRVLLEFSKVMAPFLPFCTEAIYRNLTAKAPAEGNTVASVHLAPFPSAESVTIDEDLVEKMRLTRAIVSMGRALRSRFSIKTRQPLSDMTVIIRDQKKRSLMLDMELLVREELNVKRVRFNDNEDSVVSLSAKADFRRLGKRYGPKMKEAAKSIEAFTSQQIDRLEKGETIDVLGSAIGLDDIEIRRTKREGVVVETQEDMTVALNTEITKELEEECAAREFVNRVQNLRKKSDLKLTDRIAVRCACSGRLQEALRHFEGYICNETLAKSIDWSLDTRGGPVEKVEINDDPADVQLNVIG
jgi:isoleucyl-tRNA synthetase